MVAAEQKRGGRLPERGTRRDTGCGEKEEGREEAAGWGGQSVRGNEEDDRGRDAAQPLPEPQN